jgi:hypothetical protein
MLGFSPQVILINSKPRIASQAYAQRVADKQSHNRDIKVIKRYQGGEKGSLKKEKRDS